MGLRDIMRALPSWLGDHYPDGASFGYRTLWSAALLVDGQLQVVLEASLAAVGRGTPTSLKYLSQARGVPRGRLDTDASFATKLGTWIDRAKAMGSQRGLARELAEYLGDSRVRVINRSGHWITHEADGTVTEDFVAWDWDSVSHPERADYWSELWIVIYPTWAVSGDWGDGSDWGDDGYGVGHLAPRAEFDAVKTIIMQNKAAHSLVRAVIWTSDTALFDPLTPASLPDGEWGAWGGVGSGSRVASNRDTTVCRYWEPT